MRYKIFVLLGIIALFTSCLDKDPNKQVEEGTVEANVYHSPEMGWKIEIPEGWEVMSKDATDQLQEKGMDAIAESTNANYDVSKLKTLISFQKDQGNLFQSTSESYNETTNGPWIENFKTVKELIAQTYASQGLSAKLSEIQQLKIDGVEFQMYNITLYDTNGGVLLNQVLYGALRNGADFAVNINYRDAESEKELMKAWRNSTFK